jgi:hypothetical protein
MSCGIGGGNEISAKKLKISKTQCGVEMKALKKYGGIVTESSRCEKEKLVKA